MKLDSRQELIDLIESLLSYNLSEDWSMQQRDRAYIHPSIARAIKSEDPNEELTHVIIGPKEATLWRIQDWRVTEERYFQQKAAMEERNRERDRRVALHDKIRIGVIKATGFNPDTDKEHIEKVVDLMVKQRNIDAIRALCGELGITKEEL